MTQTLEETALLQAILADPLDDTARLVYADWLDEHDGEVCAEHRRSDCPRLPGGNWVPNGYTARAEFIRSQIRVPTLRGCDPVCSHEYGHGPRCQLEERDDLRERYEELFTPDWLPYCDGQLREWYFEQYPANNVPDRPFSFLVRRGFVAEVRCTLADWLTHGPAIVRAHPVEVVRATDREPSGAEELSVLNWSWVIDPAEDRLLSEEDRPHFIPYAVWDCQEGYLTAPSPRVRARRYVTRAEATKALSAALLKWAKQQPDNG